MPWRTLVYTGEQWGSYIKAQPSSPSTLPLVLPVLLVQRPARSTPSRLSDILALPPELREHFASPIELTLYVDDLSRSVLDDPCADSGHLALVEATRTLLHAYKNDDAVTLQRLTTLGRLFDPSPSTMPVTGATPSSRWGSRTHRTGSRPRTSSIPAAP